MIPHYLFRRLSGILLASICCFVSASDCLAEVIRETGSLTEFYAGREERCTYDNWVSHVSEGVARAGYNDYAPVEIDRQTNGFGNYTIVDSLENPDGTLAYFYRIFSSILAADLDLAVAILDSSGYSDRYKLVLLSDGEKRYLIVREVLNNDYRDDNGTQTEDDDVTGSFDLGWGLFVFDLDPATGVVAIEAPHPEEDYISPYIAIDAFTTIGARAIFVAGANRETKWTNEGNYDNTKALSDPTRARKSIFTMAHKAFVDSIEHEFVIQIHSYDSRQRRFQQCLISSYPDNRPNRPIFDDRSNFDILHLMERFPIAANSIGGQAHAAVRIDDYAAIWTLGDSIFYEHEIYIPCTTRDLAGWYSPQRDYSIRGRDSLRDDENFMHTEHDEFPNVIQEPIAQFYPVGGVPTYHTFGNAVEFYHPLYAAVNAYYHQSRTRHVPRDYATIQSAIDASLGGDTILVEPGTYYGSIDFHGKNVVVASLFLLNQKPEYIDSTLIDGRQRDRVVTFSGGENDGAKLIGLTIRDGSAIDGAGIYCFDASPEIRNCVIAENRGRIGAAIYCEQSSPLLINCTIVDNVAGATGGGLFCTEASRPVVRNCILWENEPQSIYFSGTGDPNGVVVSYTDIEGGRERIETRGNGGVDWAEGNQDRDPLFFEGGDNHDPIAFHLHRNSPCIDAGDPASPRDFDGSRADAGAVARLTRSIVAAPVNLDFGEQYSGRVDSLPLVVTNRGYLPKRLTSRSLAPANSPFRIAGDTARIDIQASASHIFWVVYSPIEPSEDNANFTISTNEFDEVPIEISLTGEAMGVDGGELLPLEFAIRRIYPNPFNGTATVRYSLENTGQFSLELVSVSGRVAAMLENGLHDAGSYEVALDADSYPAGVYFVRLTAGTKIATMKAVILK